MPAFAIINQRIKVFYLRDVERSPNIGESTAVILSEKTTCALHVGGSLAPNLEFCFYFGISGQLQIPKHTLILQIILPNENSLD
ncbi:hypothetical protein HI914_02275 [Erysiphe necator]|nr:hypothetical protein HI914_02275 [Erysiphe necator]